MGYEYSVVAVGESAKRSEANDGNFNFDKNCNRFNTIKISSSNFADSKEVSSGTAVTLSVPDAQASKCLSNIEWFFKGNSLGNGNEQVVRPNEMINEYTVKCSKVNNGSYSPPTSCESKVVIKTIPWCETTTIKTSSTNVSEGEQILLTREKNCEVAQKSYWADAAGNVLSETNNLLVKPQYGAINTWYLNCVNGEETCRVPSPIISVIKDEDDCKKKQIALPKMDEYHALFQLPGCTNIVKWEVIGSEGETISKLVKKRNSIFRSIPLIKTIVSTFTTRNILSKYAFPDSYLSQFSDKNTIVVYRQNKTSTKVPVPIEQITVKATCAKTPEYNCVISKTIDNQGSCENFQCSSYIASNDINGGEAVDLRIASSLDNNSFSEVTNANLANKSAMFASTMVGNIFSVLGISTNDIIEAEKNQILSWDAYTSCNGYEFKYFWDELGESGINKQIQKKSYPQVFHVTKSYESREAEGEIRACPQKLEVVVPAKKEGQTNSENFGLKTITLENQIEYIFPANCQNEFEDGFLLLESPKGYSFVKNSEVVPIKVLPKPWYLKASCILSGNVYTDTYKGEKSGAERSLEIMYWAAFIGKLYVNNFVEDDGLFTSDIIAAFTKCFPESSTVNSDNGKVNSANLQNLKIEGKIEEQTIKNTEMALSTTGERCYDMKNLKIGTQIATNLGLVLKQLIEATKLYDKATFSFDPSTFNQSDLQENASLTTFFPLNNDFIEYTKKYGTATKSANENYLSVNVTKKVLENLCQKTQQMGLQSQSKEMLCKLRSAFKNIGVDLPDPVKDPQKIQDFKEGNCASMVAYWGGEKTAISSANAQAILAQNDAIITSVGDGECSDESNNTLTVTPTPKQPTCKNNDGEISVSATGGSGSYEYKLSTSTTWQVAKVFKSLKPGTYTVLVKDSKGNNGKINVILKDNCKPMIIFVNGHWSKLIPGPSIGGKGYWDYFDDNHTINVNGYFNIGTPVSEYVDGSSFIAIDTDFNDRRNEGKNYALQNFTNWNKKVGDMPYYLVAHSEGCGMAAGIADYLLSQNKKIGETILLSCDEGAERLSSIDNRSNPFQIEYMYWDKTLIGGNCEPEFDWVIGTNLRYSTYSGIKGVNKFGIIVQNDLGWGTVHGPSAGNRWQNQMRDLKNVQIINNWNGGLPFNTQTPVLNRTMFFKINSTIINTTNPQWDTTTNRVNYSLPCNPK